MEDIDVNKYIEVSLAGANLIKTEIKEEPLDTTSSDNEQLASEEALKYFQCNRCDYKTKRRYEMKNHIAANHFGLRFKCDQCDYEGKRKDKLKAHKKRIHEGVKTVKKPSTELFPCSQCSYVSRRRYELKIHVESCHEGVRYSCAFCPYSGKRKDKLTAHLKTKHSESLAQLKHLASPRTEAESHDPPAASTSDLLDFVKVTVQNGETSLEIPEETLQVGGRRLEGMEQEEQSRGPYFNCLMCPYSSRNKNSLNSHMKAIHRTA